MTTVVRGKIVMNNSFLSCDGKAVTANFSGLVPKTWDTGIQVVVPEGQMCLFLPKNSRKFKRKTFSAKAEDEPQTLVIKSLVPEMKMKQGRVIGFFYFFTLAPSPKLEWN